MHDKRPTRLLIGCAILLSAATILGAVVSAVSSHNNALADNERELSNTALILAEHSERTFQAVDLIHASIQERMNSLGIDSRQAFEQRMSGRDVHLMLKDKIGNLPQIAVACLTSVDGVLINFTRSYPSMNLDVSDRDYIDALRSDPELISFVSRPLLNPSTGERTLYFARKFIAKNGEFVGIVGVGVDLAYFETFFSSVTLRQSAAIGLFRRDGLLLARYPKIDPTIGLNLTHGTPLQELTNRVTDRAMRSDRWIDGSDRLMVAHNLRDYPIVITAETRVSSAFAGWYQQTKWLIILTSVSLCSIGLCSFVLLRQWLKNHNRIVYLAHYDALTGLPNRALFNEKLDQSLSAVSGGLQLALHYLDLDQFKNVNDTLGHPVGDQLLKAVAARLRSCVGELDIAARLGGDEFAIIQFPVTKHSDIIDFSKRIHDEIRKPFDLGGQRLVADVSIGISVAPDDGLDATRLLKCADLALYEAKNKGRARHCFFAPEMDIRVTSRRALECDLRMAIAAGELEVYYQPLINIASNKIVGCEALVRWPHVERGMISPAEFIPIAEESGLIVPLGEWVLRTACAQAANWPGDLRIAVNVSPIQFKTGNVLSVIMSAIATAGLRAERLEIEITEALLLHDDEQTMTVLNRLRQIGVRIAMDDFGTGYSSLAYLHRFPIDKVKIDRCFIEAVSRNEASIAVVQAVIGIAHSRKIATTAEGVETDEQLDALRRLGCTEMQGYLFSPALCASDVLQLLSSRRSKIINAA